jgi:hypothetical protein
MEVDMRVVSTAVAGTMAAMLLTGGVYAQTKAAPEKAQGAGAECARIADPGKRDECVHQQKSGSSGTMMNRDSDRSRSGTSTRSSTSGSTSGPNTTDTGRSTTNMGPNTTTSGSQSNTSSGTGGASGSMDSDRAKRSR